MGKSLRMGSVARHPFGVAVTLPVVALAAAAVAWYAGRTVPLDVEEEDLRPGLLAVYRSAVEPEAALTRVEARPAFSLGNSSPHPRLPPGPFEVVWTGALALADP